LTCSVTLYRSQIVTSPTRARGTDEGGVEDPALRDSWSSAAAMRGRVRRVVVSSDESGTDISQPKGFFSNMMANWSIRIYYSNINTDSGY
jgi:hypothetical protein